MMDIRPVKQEGDMPGCKCSPVVLTVAKGICQRAGFLLPSKSCRFNSLLIVNYMSPGK